MQSWNNGVVRMVSSVEYSQSRRRSRAVILWLSEASVEGNDSVKCVRDTAARIMERLWA
jgi:hypothetical protein